jgi:hypothetical protein
MTLPCFFILRANRVLVTILGSVRKLKKGRKICDLRDSHTATENSNQNSQEWEGTDTLVPSSLLLKGYRVRFEEEVKFSVYKCHVDSDKE